MIFTRKIKRLLAGQVVTVSNHLGAGVGVIVLALLFTACSRYEAVADPVEIVEVVEVIEAYEATEESEPVSEEIPPNPPCPIDELIYTMSVYQKIGQLFVARMPTMQQAESLIELGIGGFVFFGSDVQSIEQMQNTISHLQSHNSVYWGAINIPLFIAVDEEGGRVSRVGRLLENDAQRRIATPFIIGQTGEPDRAYYMYYAIGNQLSYLGFNMNFAPVADIWTNPQNAVIGDRAFGTEPQPVAEMVATAVQGLNSAGILSVIKHFPGHGDTVEDSHYLRAFYNHDRARFDSVEAIPFKSGIQAGADAVMMAHIVTPLLTPDAPYQPATFSSYLIQDVLRGEMGFEGLVITDALDMRALTDYYSLEEILLNSFLAGVDILLMPQNPHLAHQIMMEAYENGLFTTERLHESLRRILNKKDIKIG